MSEALVRAGAPAATPTPRLEARPGGRIRGSSKVCHGIVLSARGPLKNMRASAPHAQAAYERHGLHRERGGKEGRRSMRLTARRMATRLATSPKWQAVPLGLAGAARLARRPRRGVPRAQAGQGLRQDRQPRGASCAPAPRDQARAAPALPGVLRGDVGGAELASGAAPARRGSLRRRMRSSARRRRGGSLRANGCLERAQAPKGRRHLPRAAPGHRRAHARLLYAERIRHRAADRRARRATASWSSAAPACSSPIATSARSSCCGTACGPMCASTRST